MLDIPLPSPGLTGTNIKPLEPSLADVHAAIRA